MMGCHRNRLFDNVESVVIAASSRGCQNLRDLMPCGEHQSNDNRCPNCLMSELLRLNSEVHEAVDHAPPKFNQTIGTLSKFCKFDSKRKGQESIPSIIASLNAEILKARTRHKTLEKLILFEQSYEGGGMVAPSNPDEITGAHRRAYRRLIRQAQQWAGLSDLHALARAYGVRVRIHYQSTGRDVWVGEGRECRLYALVFTGNHYEVVSIGGVRIPTNELGDCAFESFLIVMVQERMHQEATESARTRILERFQQHRAQYAVGGGPVGTGGDYAEIISDLRTYLATSMTDEELGHAILAMAGGVLKEREERGSSREDKGSGSKLKLGIGDTALSLPWGRGFRIRSKRVGQTGYIPLTIGELVGGNVYTLGSNFRIGGNLLSDTVDYLQELVSSGRGAMDEENQLYSEGVSSGELEFLDTEGRRHTYEDVKTTHINSCLIRVRTGSGTRLFVCAGVNMHCGDGSGAGAIVATMKNGNGLHSEKYSMGLVQFALCGMGLALHGGLQDPLGDYGDVVGGSSGEHGIEAIELIFVNIADMCITCRGYWANFRAVLLKAGIKSVTCRVFYIYDDIKNWK
jgi:hypothetical protein